MLALIKGEPLIIPAERLKQSTAPARAIASSAQLPRSSRTDSRFIAAMSNTPNAAASICVQRMGAAPSMPTVEDVKALLVAERSSKC